MLEGAASRAGQLAAPGLSPRPRRGIAVLACMDTRIDVLAMLGLERGDAHIIRNAGGLVTDDAIRSLSVSQRLLGTTEVVVVMHDGCGLHGASEDQFAQALAADGVLPSWRLGAFEDVESTLRHSLHRLRSSRELPQREHVRGFVFNPETGRLRRGGGRRAEPLAPGSPTARPRRVRRASDIHRRGSARTGPADHAIAVGPVSAEADQITLAQGSR